MELTSPTPLESWLFYLFSAGMIYAAFLTIACRNAVNSAIALVISFFFMAGLFVLLDAVFLAAVQVLVYAGAVMVLFLFVIMLLDVVEEERRRIHPIIGGISALAGTALFVEFVVVLRRAYHEPVAPLGNLSGTTEAVGRLLFSEYLMPFEVTSLILLVAMIGVILLSRKESAS